MDIGANAAIFVSVFLVDNSTLKNLRGAIMHLTGSCAGDVVYCHWRRGCLASRRVQWLPTLKECANYQVVVFHRRPFSVQLVCHLLQMAFLRSVSLTSFVHVFEAFNVVYMSFWTTHVCQVISSIRISDNEREQSSFASFRDVACLNNFVRRLSKTLPKCTFSLMSLADVHHEQSALASCTDVQRKQISIAFFKDVSEAFFACLTCSVQVQRDQSLSKRAFNNITSFVDVLQDLCRFTTFADAAEVHLFSYLFRGLAAALVQRNVLGGLHFRVISKLKLQCKHI